MNTDIALNSLLAILYQHNAARLADVKRAGRKFAHYTSAENALNIISRRSVWLRNAAVMNDHSEIEHGRAILNDVLESPLGIRFFQAIDNVHDGISLTIRTRFYQEAHDAREMTYMTSLCEHEAVDGIGRLSMWRAYGGPRASVALVFKPLVVTDPTLALGLTASPVLYGDSKQFAAALTAVVDDLEKNPAIIAALDDMTVAHVVAGVLHFALLSMKHQGFEEEREWRILCPVRELPPQAVVKRHIRSIGGIPQQIYEIPFHGKDDVFLPQLRWDNMLDSIIVGPSLYPDVIKQALEAELRSQEVMRWDQLVSISDIPLRSAG